MSSKVVFAGALVAVLSFLAQHSVAEHAPSIHRGPWPIYNGFNYQPMQNELRALHQQDVMPDQARETAIVTTATALMGTWILARGANFDRGGFSQSAPPTPTFPARKSPGRSALSTPTSSAAAAPT
jgi:hypothetical protein